MQPKRSNTIQPEQLEIDGLSVTLIRSSRRRTLSLEVDHSGIRARAPNKMALRDIVRFVRLKKTWLITQLKNAPSPVEELSLKDESFVPLNGNMLPIIIERRRGAITIIEHQSSPTIAIPITGSHLTNRDSVHRKLLRWYRKLSQEQLTELVGDLLPIMEQGLGGIDRAPLVRVRDYKRRWGSCDQKGNLSFNWRLIMAPREVQRYVVIHELAHRKEFNHSRRFWQIVERYDGEWKTHQQWLQINGFELYRI